MAINVLYEDNHLLAVLKPFGLLTQVTNQCQDALETRAKAYLQRPYLHPIHRLDRDVGGIVLFAKTSKALSRLQAAMREQKITRRYLAEVAGHIKEPKGRLDMHLKHASHHARIAKKGEEGAKSASLRYERLRSNLLLIDLETGRYHQIRALLAASAHPIIGDTLYGGPPAAHIHLFHVEMELMHPVTQVPLSIKADPKDLNWQVFST